MKLHLKGRLRMCLAAACFLAVVLCAADAGAGSVHAANDISSLEKKTSGLQSQLDKINSELVEISDEISSTELQIEATTDEIAKTQQELAAAQKAEDEQYSDMKTRIKYMYEKGELDMLTVLFTARNMPDFLNKAEFVRNISTYDRTMLDELQDVRKEIDEKKAILDSQQASLEELKAQLKTRQDELDRKAAETSTNLVKFTAELEKLRAEKARKEAEAALAAQKASEKAAQETSGSASGGGSPYPSGNGVLTKRKGVNYFNGFKETYYNLDMSGVYRQARARGLQGDDWIRADGVKMFGPYIVTATAWDIIPYGSVFECSLGTAISLDTGSFAYKNPYQVDIAVNW